MVYEYPEAEDMGFLWVRLMEARCRQVGEVLEPLGCECPALLHSSSVPEWQPSETGSELGDPMGFPHRCCNFSSFYLDGMEWWGRGCPPWDEGSERAKSQTSSACLSVPQPRW